MQQVNSTSRAAKYVLLKLFVLGVALLPVSAVAELLPDPAKVALPEEKALLDQTFSRLLEEKPANRAAHLAALQGLVAKFPRPTPLRGMIQFLRASALAQQHEAADSAAREAVDESVRLLPGYSGPLLLASYIYTYSDQPGPAADYLIRASHIDPDIVSKMPEYEVDNIFGRLTFHGDQRRVRILSERLLEIGWLAESQSSRSLLARRAIEARMAAGNLAGAKALIPKLLNPSDSRRLLTQTSFQPLWPEIERWAGPKLENQWRIYLAEARANWEASRDPATALAYVRALDAAGHDDTIIREMLPLFSKPLGKREDYDLIFVAASVAEALAAKGRWSEIEPMYIQASTTWKLGDEANALNLALNRARYLFYGGKPSERLALLDAPIADSARWGGQIGGNVLAGMHSQRACMLHLLGRGDEAIASRAQAAAQRNPVSVAILNLCLGKYDLARDLMVAALTDEMTRDDVIAFVQPNDEPPMQSEHGRLIHERVQALRSDPKLLAAVTKYGRVLPFSLRAGAPVEVPPGKAAIASH